MVRIPTETEDSGAASSGTDTTETTTRRVTDSGALQSLVAECAERGEAVYPAGGRTAWNYGGEAARPGIVVETTGLDRVIDYPSDDMTITVEAGMTLARLQEILAEKDQYLPIDPPDAGRATLGGVMATGWTGPRRHQALKPRDQIIGIGFVDGLGRIVRGGGRVVKNVAGYDFPKLLTGSMGSLGVIAELTFKVRPRPESTAVAWVQLPDGRRMGQFLDTMNRSATRPTALEVLNRERAREVGGATGLPTGSEFVVAVGFDDSAKAVSWQCETLHREMPDGSFVDFVRDAEAAHLWTALTQGIAIDGDPQPVVARVVTRPSRLGEFVSGSDSSVWSIQAHGGQGIATLRAIVELSQERTRAFAEKFESEVAEAGGSVVWPGLPREWKSTIPVWGRHRPSHVLMAGVKTALDPHNILNPGRFMDLG